MSYVYEVARCLTCGEALNMECTVSGPVVRDGDMLYFDEGNLTIETCHDIWCSGCGDHFSEEEVEESGG